MKHEYSSNPCYCRLNIYEINLTINTSLIHELPLSISNKLDIVAIKAFNEELSDSSDSDIMEFIQDSIYEICESLTC